MNKHKNKVSKRRRGYSFFSRLVNKKVIVPEHVQTYWKTSKGSFISPQKRQVFKFLDQQPYEVGGNLDFHPKKGLEQMTMNFGDGYMAEWEVDPDFEATFHTHPWTKNKWENYINHLPSEEDTKNFLDFDNEQMTLLSHGGNLTLMVKTKRFNDLKNSMSKQQLGKEIDKLHKELEIEVADGMAKKHTVASTVKDVSALFDRLGVKLIFVPKETKGKINIPISVVEKAKPRKAGMNPPMLINQPLKYDELTSDQIEMIKRTLPEARKESAIQDKMNISKFLGKNVFISSSMIRKKPVRSKVASQNKLVSNAIEDTKEIIHSLESAGKREDASKVREQFYKDYQINL